MFANQQWKITSSGLDAIVGSRISTMEGATPSYEIAASRLGETTERKGKTLYDWPIHMAEKKWVDIEAFIEAFIESGKQHGLPNGDALDPVRLSESVAEALKIAKRGG